MSGAPRRCGNDPLIAHRIRPLEAGASNDASSNRLAPGKHVDRRCTARRIEHHHARCVGKLERSVLIVRVKIAAQCCSAAARQDKIAVRRDHDILCDGVAAVCAIHQPPARKIDSDIFAVDKLNELADGIVHSPRIDHHLA